MKSKGTLRRIRFARKRRLGATVLEFAIVVPVFLLFVFGMIEFGRMLMVKHAMTNAAREGCRHAVLATTTNPEDVETTIRNYLQSVIPNHEAVRITVPSTLAATPSGTELTVAVEVDFSDVSWVSTGFMNMTPTISGRATQQRE